MKTIAAVVCAGLAILSASSSRVARAEDAYKILPDVIYGHKAGMALTFDVITPREPNGAAVLFIVSGGWVSTWFPPEQLIAAKASPPNLFQKIVDSGYTLFLVRHGSSPYFKVPDAVADVRRSVRYIRLHASDWKIDPERIGVFGMSAGGHLSLMLGTTADAGQPDAKDPVDQVSNRVRAVVAYFPPTKIDEFFPLKDRFPALDFNPDQADALSPLLFASDDDAPTLLIHGDKDELVPISNSERMVSAFERQKVPTELLVITGAAHGFGGADGARAEQAALDWLAKHLAKQE